MQCPTLTTQLPKPHVSPQITRQGESGVFSDCKDMVSAPTPSNSQYLVGAPLSIDFWDHICGVIANATGWGIKSILTSDASHVVQVTHTSDQATKRGSFHGPTSMLNITSNWWLNSGKPILTVLTIIYRRKLRNSEMEEPWRAKKEWRCGERSCPRDHSTLTSQSLVPTHKLAKCQNLWSFIFTF